MARGGGEEGVPGGVLVVCPGEASAQTADHILRGAFGGPTAVSGMLPAASEAAAATSDGGGWPKSSASSSSASSKSARG
ncbi:hypothetical protein APUTEX25_001722, partial [Auxenochlorella protothecoides]